ncbi:hypothetical protein SRHO_G00249580 [Serrasalmus rhombeus]
MIQYFLPSYGRAIIPLQVTIHQHRTDYCRHCFWFHDTETERTLRHEPTSIVHVKESTRANSLLRPTSLDCTASVRAVHVKFKKGEPTVQQQTGGSQKIFKSEWGAGIVDVEADGKVRHPNLQKLISGRHFCLNVAQLIPMVAHDSNQSPQKRRHIGREAVSSTSDIERKFTLPASPRLILLGNQPMTNCHWMISIEGHVVCESTQPTFASGLAALFAVFYIFNLQYQDEASKTLEFIQRRFIGINPERGSKTTHGKVVSKRTGKVVQKRAASVNPHVATLLKNLLDFEWDFI